MPSALWLYGARRNPPALLLGKHPSIGDNVEASRGNPSVAGQEGGLSDGTALCLPPAVLGVLLVRGLVGSRAPSSLLSPLQAAKGLWLSSIVRGPTAVRAWRGAAGGGHCCCCWGFLEGVGKVLLAARAAPQRTR